MPQPPDVMTQFDQHRTSVLDMLEKAGLMPFPELANKQQVGAGSMPAPRDGMAPMITSVPQADR